MDPFVSTQDDTLHLVSFFLNFSMSVSSFFALSCFWKDQCWLTQIALGTKGTGIVPRSTPGLAAQPLAGGECANQGCSGGCLGKVFLIQENVGVFLGSYVRDFQTEC